MAAGLLISCHFGSCLLYLCFICLSLNLPHLVLCFQSVNFCEVFLRQLEYHR